MSVILKNFLQKDLHQARRKFLSHSGFYSHNPLHLGEVFQTYLSTLDRYPGTLLGDPQRREEYRNRTTGQFFFDRNSEPFESVLYYYQSEGLVVCPENMDLELFINELVFFDIGEEAIERYVI